MAGAYGLSPCLSASTAGIRHLGTRTKYAPFAFLKAVKPRLASRAGPGWHITSRSARGRRSILPFVLAAGSEGPDALRQVMSALPNWEEALAGTISAYEDLLNTTLLHTPDERS